MGPRVRLVLVGIVGLMLVGFCFFGGGLTLIVHPVPVEEGTCARYLERPKERWVKLTGCRLGIDDLLLANADGVERFADRAEGLSRVLHAQPPVWTELYVPLTTGLPDDQRAIRVMYRLADRDVLKWVNAIEQADEAQRKRLLEGRSMLLRIASPGLLLGHASRGPVADVLQQALGTEAQAGLLVIEPGPVPVPEFPFPAVLAGLVGGTLLLWTLTRFLRRTPADALAQDTVDVSGVPLSLGELDAMRRDEAEARKSGKPPG